MELNNKKILSITGLEENSEVVRINFDDGTYIKQFHYQDCCESVLVAQVDGDPDRFIGATCIQLLEKVTNPVTEDYYESVTATFYTLVTSKGYLDWRWTGESNGYYSESVDGGLYDADDKSIS